VHRGAYGWRENTTSTDDKQQSGWVPQGRCVGWLDDKGLYLEPEASYAEAQDLAREQGESLTVSAQTLWRRLRDAGHLASLEEKRQSNLVRKEIEGVRRRVIHLRPDVLSPPNTDQLAHNDADD
jgi:hypothetical protein